MDWQMTPYVIPSLAGAAVSTMAALYLWVHRPLFPGSRAMVVLLLGAAEWMLCDALGQASIGLSKKVVWDNLRYLGVVIVPTAWLVFTLQYTGRAKRITRRFMVLLGFVPLITLLLVFTNEAHGLIWSRLVLDESGALVVLNKTYGVGFRLFVLYAYVLVLVAIFLLAQMLLRSGRLYRWQVTALLLAMLGPWLLSALDLLGLNPVPQLDPTALGLAVSGPVLAWSLSRLRIGDIVPVAREVTIEAMTDGVIVLDEQYRVVDMNLVAERLFGHGLKEAFGHPVEKIWPDWPDHLEDAHDETTAIREVVLGTGDEQRTYDLRVSPVLDWRGHLASHVVVLRDITERKRLEEQATLREAMAVISSTLDLPTVLTRIAEQMCLATDATSAYICDVDPERRSTVLAEHYGPEACPKERVSDLGATYEEIGEGFLAALQANKHYISHVDDPDLPEVHRSHMVQYGAQSILHTPLWIREQLIGYVDMWETRRRREFTPKEIALCRSIAQSAAIAIENARLYEAAQQELAERKEAEEALAKAKDDLEATVEERTSELSREIAERKQVAEALRESEERYRTYVENVPDVIWEADPRGRFTYWSPQIAALAGYAPQQLLGHTLFEFLVHPDDADEFRNRSQQMLDEGREMYALTHRALHRDGSVLHIETSIRPVRDDAGRVVKFQGVARDVSERVRLQVQLIQSAKLSGIGQMISGVAHELNNPLTTIMGYAQLLQTGDLDEDIQADLRIIYDDALRAKRIVENLLTFARQKKPQRTLVNINEIIEHTLALRSYQLEVDNVEVVTEVAENLPWTMADASQLQQVFLNIINNAHQAMAQGKDGGVLSITSELLDNDVIRVRFADNGPGIPRGILEKVFDPFFTTREVGTGTGLGLSVSHGIIQEHGGRIWAESEPGQGATFFVEVPVKAWPEEMAIASPDPEPGQLASQGQRILVIDDEPSIVDLLVRVLKESGYQVAGFTSAKLALERLRQDRYDLIISDIKMPGMDGPTCEKEVRAMDPALAERIIFITGDVLSPTTQAFLDEWKGKFIKKPFYVEELRAVVAEGLG